MISTCIQKITIYQTKSTFYIVGSNNAENSFRVIKIDRNNSKELALSENKIQYNKAQLNAYIDGILGDRKDDAKNKIRGNIQVDRISAYSIVGFVRFLQGYYMILITKRRRIAQIGNHGVFKILQTNMIYIPNVNERNSDEMKYYKMFQNVYLSNDFYFSYTYDLSHTLQYNLSSLNYQHYHERKEGSTIWEGKLKFEIGPTLNPESVRTLPNWKFVWNEYFLKDISLHADWILYIIHGFVSQANICVFGKAIYLTLIARRSKKFAGTRFLKRGANFEGDVANEVETEQIVFDSSVSSFVYGKYTSFVQMRGSVPSHWSQDTSKMVPKPAIVIDLADPYCITAGKHFNELLYRYGSPIIVFNLVKRQEKKPHESVLSQEIKQTMRYLNQFIPPRFALEYIGLDMARIDKSKEDNVMNKLSEKGYQMLKRVGFFMNWKSVQLDSLNEHGLCLGGATSPCGKIYQTGIVRVNCVDCLDRTNTAQFALGKCALSIQLFILGVIDKPILHFDTDAVRMLEQIYEAHGDTLALQYGGSHLVHRIKTYRKTAPLTSHSRDIMQTLSRYYSNNFSDADKQDAMNLFLGVFRPSSTEPQIWELNTDFYLHNAEAIQQQLFNESQRPCTCWWSDDVAICLPRSAMEIFKGRPENILFISDNLENDGFFEHYLPNEPTTLKTSLSFEMSHTDREFCNISPNVQISPFLVQKRAKGKESFFSSKGIPLNPSVSGHASTSTSSSSSDDNCDSEDDEIIPYKTLTINSPAKCGKSKKKCNSSRKGILHAPPKLKDLFLYKNYAEMRFLSVPYMSNNDLWCNINKLSQEDNDRIYLEYCQKGLEGIPKHIRNINKSFQEMLRF